jgi:hypothetical protein
MMRSQWAWTFLDQAEQPLDRPLSPAFTTRFDAEAWLGEHWRDLAGQGVAAARLTDRGAVASPAIALHSP